MAPQELSNESKFVQIGSTISENMSRYIVRRRLRHLFGYISGTGSLRHTPVKLDRWHHESFQMSPRLFKSVQPSPRNRSRYIVRRQLRHFFGYISGTRSVRHNQVKLDQWHHDSFQMSPSLFKSVQPSPRNRSRYIVRRRLRHFFGYIYGIGGVRHNPFKLDQWHHESF